MLRIEVLFDKLSPQKPSPSIMDALKIEIERKLKPQFPEMITRVALSTSQSIVISGTKVDHDKEKIQEMLEEIWLGDSWLPEPNEQID